MTEPTNEPVPQITTEQSNKIAATLYEPTIRRMTILVNSLITTTANGDFALWAPLTVMENALMQLRWENAASPERFLALISLTLRRYAEKCEVHNMALIAARDAGAPLPAFQVWNDEDTIAVYNEIEAKFPPPELAVTPDQQADPEAPTNEQ